MQISCYHYNNWFVLHTFQRYNCIGSSVQLQYINECIVYTIPLHWLRWMIDSLFYYLHYKWLHTHQWIIRKKLKLIANLSDRIRIFQSRLGNNYFPDFTMAYILPCDRSRRFFWTMSVTSHEISTDSTSFWFTNGYLYFRYHFYLCILNHKHAHLRLSFVVRICSPCVP